MDAKSTKYFACGHMLVPAAGRKLRHTLVCPKHGAVGQFRHLASLRLADGTNPCSACGSFLTKTRSTETLTVELDMKMSVRTETQETVARWAKKTFGPRHPMVLAARLNKEVSELLSAIAGGEMSADEIVEECADVLITLYQIPDAYGAVLDEAVDKKMPINRKRDWKRGKAGDYQHA